MAKQQGEDAWPWAVLLLGCVPRDCAGARACVGCHRALGLRKYEASQSASVQVVG